MATGDNRDASMIAALVHLYRGEVARGDAWRARLDNTTNWGITSTAAVVSFGLGSASASHAVILAGIYLVLTFLLIEAGRYRKWDVYLRRVRLLEVGLYVPLLREDPIEDQSLRELARMLDAPRIEIPFWLALAQRVRRAYGAVLGVLGAAWALKLTMHGRATGGVGGFVERAHLGFVPGSLIIAIVVTIYVVLGIVTAASFWARPPATELRARHTRRRSLKASFERVARGTASRPLVP